MAALPDVAADTPCFLVDWGAARGSHVTKTQPIQEQGLPSESCMFLHLLLNRNHFALFSLFPGMARNRLWWELCAQEKEDVMSISWMLA